MEKKYVAGSPYEVKGHGTIDAEKTDFELFIICTSYSFGMMKAYMESGQLVENVPSAIIRWLLDDENERVRISMTFSHYRKKKFSRTASSYKPENDDIYRMWAEITEELLDELHKCGAFTHIRWEYHSLDKPGTPEWKMSGGGTFRTGQNMSIPSMHIEIDDDEDD